MLIRFGMASVSITVILLPMPIEYMPKHHLRLFMEFICQMQGVQLIRLCLLTMK